MIDHKIDINNGLCIGCGICSKNCVSQNIAICDKKATIKTQSCIMCGHCAAVCPKNAITISGYDEPPYENESYEIKPETLLAAIRQRRSIRQFTSEAVSDKIINQIIEAGRWTPTAKNAQDISYVVLKDKLGIAQSHAVNLFRKLLPFAPAVFPTAVGMKIDDDFFFKGAPLAIVIVSADKVSASLAASNMALMAEANGLGVLYSGFFSVAANHNKILRFMLGLSRKRKAVTTIVIGYPNVKYLRTVQKEKADVIYL